MDRTSTDCSLSPWPMRLLASIVLVILVPGLVVSVVGQSAPALSTQAPVTGSFDGKFFVQLPIANTGSGTAGRLEVQSVALSTATLLNPSLPMTLGDIAPGAVVALSLAFDASSLVARSYLLTVRGTYTAPSGAMLGFSLNRFITFGSVLNPPHPLNVTPVLDTAHAVRQFISAMNGGTIQATGAGGSVFTLAIPANALFSDEMITMTPLSSVGALPLTRGLLAGVQLLPDGLVFQNPATLTIHPSTSVPISQQVGFGYQANGQDFYFQPLGLDGTITISLSHFSGAGVGLGSQISGVTPASIASQMQQQIQQLVNHERQCGCDPNWPDDLIALSQEWYTDIVKPIVQQALTDDNVADLALRLLTQWAQMLMFLDGSATPLLVSELEAVQAQVPAILQNVYNKAFGRCLSDTSQSARLVEGKTMIWAFKYLTSLSSEGDFLTFSRQLAACQTGTLKLDISSRTALSIVEPPITEFSMSAVSAQQLSLSFDATSLTYKGTGPLNYDRVSFSVDWPPGLTDCSSATGNPGSVSVVVLFDLNVFPFNANVSELRMNLELIPEITEDLTVCSIDDVTGKKASGNVPGRLYFSALGLIEGAEGTQFPYFMFMNTREDFNFTGSSMGATATESTTLTLAQASQ